MKILGTINLIDEATFRPLVYSVFVVNDVIYRTLTTKVSPELLYQLAVYDKTDIDETMYQLSYGDGNFRKMTIEEVSAISEKIPGVRYYIRNRVLSDILN